MILLIELHFLFFFITEDTRFLVVFYAKLLHILTEFSLCPKHAVLVLLALLVIKCALFFIILLAEFRLVMNHALHPVDNIFSVNLYEPVEGIKLLQRVLIHVIKKLIVHFGAYNLDFLSTILQ